MKKLWLLSAALVAFSVSTFADNIWSGSSNGGSSYSGGTSGVWTCTGCSLMPTTAYLNSNIASSNTTNNQNTQIPFWNNPTSDTGLAGGAKGNVGDVLAGIATGTSVVPANIVAGNVSGYYYSNSTTVANDGNLINPAAPTNVTIASTTYATETPSLEFSFQEEATAYNISVLFADSGLNTGVAGSGTVFGWYTGSGSALTLHQIGGPIVNNNGTTPTTLATGDDIDGTATTNIYGFYATVCEQYISGVCYASITFTTGAGNYGTGANISGYEGSLGWNHFALFELANGQEVLGFEDSPWALNTPNATEGTGDYNDVIIGLTGDSPLLTSQSAPEPGTIAIMGLGLAGLGLIGRRRFAKK